MFDDRHDGETRELQAQRLESAVTVCRSYPELVVCERLPVPRGWHGVGVQAARVLAR